MNFLLMNWKEMVWNQSWQGILMSFIDMGQIKCRLLKIIDPFIMHVNCSNEQKRKGSHYFKMTMDNIMKESKKGIFFLKRLEMNYHFFK